MLGQCRRSVVFVIGCQELVGIWRKMLTKPVVKPIVISDICDWLESETPVLRKSEC